ncbi:cupin domain-containing protein [Aestuariicella hydrocarbonica]|uniref:Cupin domain-containing protein n=1 Tax=Pseudomaricurvus hydrocarbonicus TaxID=1470433 RepID=A0A9E5JVE5_9GAMM|nr:cupin domain-containing protein [Aestuariicella hydrocarbonica]NHO65276.1 cupin domain-containing protein [Aestuariicella hydrocarbonica]
MKSPLTQLGNISTEDFIRDYWQQKPLLIKQALPNYQSPISPDELAGLALEEEIESRIILENGTSPWELRQGPFHEDEFSTLPKDKWTLLIQAADHFVPEVADLLDQFRFIPSWRLDDIMISYATNGGSVGPHYDQYDVFLLQAGGQRHWQVGQLCNSQSPKRDDTDLHILTEFEERASFLLEPGDMLYLPPQVAHWGKAVGDDCITYSIGFRAPSQAEILEELLQEHLSNLTEDDRFQDPAFSPQAHTGEISQAALQQIQQLWQQAITPANIEAWFGRHMTTPKYDTEDRLLPDELFADDIPEWSDEDTLIRDPASRFAFTHSADEQATLFVDGDSYQTSPALAHLLSDCSVFTGAALSGAIQTNSDQQIVDLLLANQQVFVGEA